MWSRRSNGGSATDGHDVGKKNLRAGFGSAGERPCQWRLVGVCKSCRIHSGFVTDPMAPGAEIAAAPQVIALMMAVRCTLQIATNPPSERRAVRGPMLRNPMSWAGQSGFGLLGQFITIRQYILGAGAPGACDGLDAGPDPIGLAMAGLGAALL